MNLLPYKRVKFWIVLALALLDAGLTYANRLSGLQLLLTLFLAGYALIALARLAVRRTRIIWRLRDRLIVTYIFIGAIPIVLILALAYCGAWIVVGQVATYLVGSELNRRAQTLATPCRFLSRSKPQERSAILSQMAPVLREREPGFEVLVTGDETFHYPASSTLEAPVAGWDEYTGTICRNGRFYSMSLAKNGARTAVILAPLTPEILENLVPRIGEISFSNVFDPASRLQKVSGVAGRVPVPYDILDFEYLWANPIDLVYWDAPKAKTDAYLTLHTRPSAVLAVVFGDRDLTAQEAQVIFISIMILLALVEVGSVIIGGAMTRSITVAVHNLYEGTQSIGRGDFSHTIPVKGRDQLASLGKSFNQMSAQLEKLVKVTQEKERLQSELTIASEVQNQLFPRSAPPTRTIRLTGSCEPARSVSGDYYDYLCLPNGNLALAIGDVAGKGISAALLMASIQSILRTQLAQGPPTPSTMVAQLNRQLYANTSPEKYATFFFGIYDENNRMLTYTNAGHLAPLLFCGGKVCPLEVTGTVVGLFPSITYKEEAVRLCDGDLLVAYTDGITEPENAYGEEYGADRLTETVQRYQNLEPSEIVARVMESVKHWSGAPELPDDMTVLIARGVA